MKVKVNQEDREAARPILHYLYGTKAGADGSNMLFERDVLNGVHDDHYLVQAFARHRIAAFDAGLKQGKDRQDETTIS